MIITLNHSLSLEMNFKVQIKVFICLYCILEQNTNLVNLILSMVVMQKFGEHLKQKYLTLLHNELLSLIPKQDN